MKTLPAALAAHYAQDALTVATAIRITRRDGQVYGFTSHDVPFSMGGVDYDAAQGLDASQIVTSAGFNVDNLELSTLDDGTLFTTDDVLGGRWDGAAFLIFRYNWAAPPTSLADVEPLLAGTFGELQRGNGRITVELRGLQQYLQQPIGNVTSKTCRARFADYPAPAGSNRCRLSVAAYTFSGTVSSVSSRREFAAAAMPQADTADYYGEGIVTWATGANAGLRQKVRSHAAGGVITLSLPMPADIQVGDTFQIVAGCRKRLQEDCRDKFNNVLNFAGEPHLPGLDAVTATPEPGG